MTKDLKWYLLWGLFERRTSELPDCCRTTSNSEGKDFVCSVCGARWLGENNES